MSERLFRFTLKELKMIRAVCPKCGAVTEMPIDTLDSAPSTNCRCGNQFFSLTHNPLSILARTIRDMGSTPDAQFEFAIPMDE
jgi:uncharacterized paraquat-inducible protein A